MTIEIKDAERKALLAAIDELAQFRDGREHVLDTVAEKLRGTLRRPPPEAQAENIPLVISG